MSPTLATALAHQRKYCEPTAAELDLPEDWWRLRELENACYQQEWNAQRRRWRDHGAAAAEHEERERRRPKKAIAQRVQKRLGKAVE